MTVEKQKSCCTVGAAAAAVHCVAQYDQTRNLAIGLVHDWNWNLGCCSCTGTWDAARALQHGFLLHCLRNL